MIIVLKQDDVALNAYKFLGWICTFIFILGILPSLYILRKKLPKYQKLKQPIKMLEKLNKKRKKEKLEKEKKKDVRVEIKSSEDLQIINENKGTKKIHIKPLSPISFNKKNP